MSAPKTVDFGKVPRFWNMDKAEIQAQFTSRASLQTKCSELCGGNKHVLARLLTDDDHITYIFMHPTNICKNNQARISQARPTDVSQARPTDVSQARPTDVSQARPTDVSQARPTGASQSQSRPISASRKDKQNNKDEQNKTQNIFDMVSKPGTNDDIATVLNKMNSVYKSEILTAENINTLADAGYTPKIFITAISKSVVSQEGILALLGYSMRGGLVKIHQIIQFFDKHYKCNDNMDDLPIDDILAIFGDTFNFILTECDDMIGYKALYILVKNIWQMKDYCDVRRIKGANKITIGNLRNESVDVLVRQGCVEKIYKGEEKDDKKDDKKEEKDDDNKSDGSPDDDNKSDEKDDNKSDEKDDKKGGKKRKGKGGKKGKGSGGNRYPQWKLRIRAPTEVVRLYRNGEIIIHGVTQDIGHFTEWCNHNNIDTDSWARKRGGALELERFINLNLNFETDE